jgi:hypothetical protein
MCSAGWSPVGGGKCWTLEMAGHLISKGQLEVISNRSAGKFEKSREAAIWCWPSKPAATRHFQISKAISTNRRHARLVGRPRGRLMTYVGGTLAPPDGVCSTTRASNGVGLDPLRMNEPSKARAPASVAQNIEKVVQVENEALRPR